MEADIDTLQTGKANVNHTHNEYSPINHEHSEYALVNHSHTGYALIGHTHSYNDLEDKPVIPTTLPANGGNSDTVDGKHAADFATVESVDMLQTLVGSTSVQSQISTAVGTITPTSIGAAEEDHVHNYNDLTNKPTSLPANGGNADTVDGKHASDFATASDVATLQTLVGSTSVSSQIATAIAGVSGPVRAGTGTSSVIEGDLTHNTASGNYSHSEGRTTSAVGAGAHAEGGNLSESGTGTMISLTISKDTYPMIGDTDIVMEGSTAYGVASHAEGTQTFAFGYNAHAEGERTRAMGKDSHAEGYSTIATGERSYAEGIVTLASGKASHVEGESSEATGNYSHAEGKEGMATGGGSHAEGWITTASGAYAHAEGLRTIASGEGSHAAGIGTVASRKAQCVFGYYNIEDTTGTSGSDKGKYIQIVGNGMSNMSHSNAYTLDWDGNGWFKGTVEGNALILKSSTSGSTKRFKITVNDSGAISATEVTT